VELESTQNQKPATPKTQKNQYVKKVRQMTEKLAIRVYDFRSQSGFNLKNQIKPTKKILNT
jgi:glycyl-tRNA synthetase alpha subunit